MTRDDVIRMAKEAGFRILVEPEIEWIDRFAALVAAAEREACVAIAKEAVEGATVSKYATSLAALAARSMAAHLIDAIRARGQK